MTLYDELKSFQGTSFRNLYQRFIYIDCRELLEEMFSGELDEGMTGVFAYCYIDGTEGLSFRPFMLAKMSEDSMQVFTLPHQEDTLYILRLREGVTKMSEAHEAGRHLYLYAVNPQTDHYIDLSVLNNIPLEDFSVIKNNVDENYKVSDDRELLRSDKFAFLDIFRNELYPDDVKVLLFREDIGIEQVWVRASFVAEKEIFGVLLNEPYQDYGCHEGELIGFVVAKNGDEKVLVHTGHIARKVEK